jgi:GT2 family glycosyltransferase
MADLEGQTLQSFEVILSIGFKPNGHARNQGVRAATGEYLVCIDDDVRLGHERILEQLVAVFLEHDKVGLVGPSQRIPEDSTPFQQRSAREISRSQCDIVSEVTDSDFVSHMCLCIPTQLYKDIGWESDTLARGTDPDLRRRLREAGYRIVIAPNCWAYHPMPTSWGSLIRQSWRNGAGASWVQKNHPEMCIDTPDGHHGGSVIRHSLAYRALRFVFRFAQRFVAFHYVGLVTDLVYACGYAYGMILGADGLRTKSEIQAQERIA